MIPSSDVISLLRAGIQIAIHKALGSSELTRHRHRVTQVPHHIWGPESGERRRHGRRTIAGDELELRRARRIRLLPGGRTARAQRRRVRDRDAEAVRKQPDDAGGDRDHRRLLQYDAPTTPTTTPTPTQAPTQPRTAEHRQTFRLPVSSREVDGLVLGRRLHVDGHAEVADLHRDLGGPGPGAERAAVDRRCASSPHDPGRRSTRRPARCRACRARHAPSRDASGQLVAHLRVVDRRAVVRGVTAADVFVDRSSATSPESPCRYSRPCVGRCSTRPGRRGRRTMPLCCLQLRRGSSFTHCLPSSWAGAPGMVPKFM